MFSSSTTQDMQPYASARDALTWRDILALSRAPNIAARDHFTSASESTSSEFY
jgi:hypothetical protein